MKKPRCESVNPAATRNSPQCVRFVAADPKHRHRIHRDVDGNEWEDPPAEPENAFWRELRQATQEQPLATLHAALQPYRCCGTPNLCGVPCQDSELAGHLAVAEQLVREELERSTDGVV